uniref:Uncharacterized protein n=1 Tax=Oryza sativa subsp. japonica TaxID=39947 RepID=Q6ERQ4_ORYSJ|nr:hypothetical protein [Oryza sativa Japonica Group]BAD33492.1 hypothetical protein [Oryza sativa Japonica Group]
MALAARQPRRRDVRAAHARDSVWGRGARSGDATGDGNGAARRGEGDGDGRQRCARRGRGAGREAAWHGARRGGDGDSARGGEGLEATRRNDGDDDVGGDVTAMGQHAAARGSGARRHARW